MWWYYVNSMVEEYSNKSLYKEPVYLYKEPLTTVFTSDGTITVLFYCN